MGRVLQKVKRTDLAIDDNGEAIRLDPSSPDHYDSRGSLCARNNAYDRAIADFNEAIRLQPKASYFMNRGNAFNLKGDPDRAIADYDEALRLELAMAYNNRGVAPTRAKGSMPWRTSKPLSSSIPTWSLPSNTASGSSRISPPPASVRKSRPPGFMHRRYR
jgi:tetratricopeptide (TPR) repeat protein